LDVHHGDDRVNNGVKNFARRQLRRLGVVALSPQHLGARIAEHQCTNLFEILVLRCFPDLEGRVFIQIGANDGLRYDPLAKFVSRHQWSGIMLEPMPVYFRALHLRHGTNPRLKLMQAALDHQAGTRPIYSIANCDGLPEWAHGLASLDRSRVEQAARELQVSASAVTREEIKTVTWGEISESLEGRACDILVLDTEGFDIPLLRAGNLAQLRPRIIHFEHACATVADQDAFNCELRRLGYELVTEGADTTAWLPMTNASTTT
jgi:FkbM family methyltransferase